MTGKASAAESMALIIWQDVFERIDTLILEIRHVQETLASHLRQPNLYEVFRYEDKFLWGRYEKGQTSHQPSDWSTILDRVSTDSAAAARACASLAAAWCPEFPSPKGDVALWTIYQEQGVSAFADEFFKFDDRNRLRADRERVSRLNLFSASDDRLYYALRHLQLLKRDLLRDKLLLARVALKTFTNDGIQKLHLIEFLLLRNAVLHRLYTALDALRDFLSTIQDTLSLSIEQDPPPSIRRRRDQGIYTSDLADNCRFISSEIVDLFEFLRRQHGGYGHAAALNNPTTNTSSQRDRIAASLLPDIDVIVHRYTRDRTSYARYDTLGRGFDLDETIRKRAGVPATVGFVKSSFWMPERPDLQTIISHEIAHLLLRRHYGDLDSNSLMGLSDTFAKLLTNLGHALEQHAPDLAEFNFVPARREALLREFACDLIGISLHKTAYAFVHFLELLGHGCDVLFESGPHDNRDPILQSSILDLARERITSLRHHQPDWIVRITVAMALLETLDDGKNPLTETVRKGALDIVEQTGAFLANAMHGPQKAAFEMWYRMAALLRSIVQKSEFAKLAKDWNKTRITEAERWTTENPDGGPLNRFAPKLPKTVTDHCLGAWLDRLVERPRLLATYLENNSPTTLSKATIHAAFKKLYLDGSGSSHPDEILFQFLIDVPWQSALLTTRDFLGDSDRALALSRAEWITGLHEFSWLGRDLYHLALEYVVWYERQAIGRFKAVTRWLDLIVNLLDQLKPPLTWPSLASTIHSVLGDAKTITFDQQPIAEIVSMLAQRDTFDIRDLDSKISNIKAFALAASDPLAASSALSNAVKPNRVLHAIDSIASKRMDQISRILLAELKLRVESHSLRSHFERIVDEKPDLTSNEKLSARGLKEVIRIIHYISARPECRPDLQLLNYELEPGEEFSWASMFMQYLDVPVEWRKLNSQKAATLHPAGTVKYLEGVVPSRSIRVDRISHSYGTYNKIDRPNGASLPGHTPSALHQKSKPLFWQTWHEGNRPTSTTTNSPQSGYYLHTKLLGRFDALTLQIAKHTARSSVMPQSGTQSASSQRKDRGRETAEGQGSSEGQLETAFFRRQQIGLPFSARRTQETVGRSQWPRQVRRVLRADEHPTFARAFHAWPSSTPPTTTVPLATISALLTQRSARLTFVERLVNEDSIMQSLCLGLRSQFRFFRPDYDIGLLTDGWGDLFLVMFGSANSLAGVFDNTQDLDGQLFDRYVENCQHIGVRLKEINDLRKALFEDELVVRTETTYTPLAIDTALLNPQKFQCNISVRFKPSMDRVPGEDFERGLLQQLERNNLTSFFTVSRVSGRMDYAISAKPATDPNSVRAALKSMLRGAFQVNGSQPPDDLLYVYGIVFEKLRSLFFGEFSSHIDSTTTTISEIMA